MNTLVVSHWSTIENCFLPAELEAIAAINVAIRLGAAEQTVEELLRPEAQLPIVYQTAANLYQAELFSLQLQGGRVSREPATATATRGTLRRRLSFTVPNILNSLYLNQIWEICTQ